MRRLVTNLIFLFSSVITLFSQDVTFSAEAPRTVVKGSRFQLVYTVNKEASDLRVPDLPDFQILMGPSTSTSSSVSMINGNVSRNVSYSFTYILRADKTGTFNIPAATVEAGGKKIESNKLTIEVIESDASSSSQPQQQQAGTRDQVDAALSNDDLFITLTANKTEVYQDEPVLITTKIYTKVALESISNIKNPEFKNFVVEELLNTHGQMQWSVENVNGTTYRVGTFSQKVIYPQVAGRQNIEPMSIEFTIRQRQTRQSRSIFDDFFDNYRTVKKSVTSKGLNINVKPLPTPRPSSFSGVVGDIAMNVSASKTDVKANDGITLKVTLTGTGNLRLAGNPQIKYPHDFDVFDPKITNNLTQTAQGSRGTRTMETLIIPRHSGTFEIPSVEYSYFNPSTGSYKTLRSNPITINVERSENEEIGGGGYAPSPGSSSRENVRFLGTDIRFIKTGDIKLKPVNTFMFGNTWFILGYVLPIILFLIIFVVNRKRIKENADIQKVKTKKANKVARKRLKKSATHLKKDEKEAFYEELSRALWGYTSDKLSIPLSELNRDNAKSILTERGADETLTEDFLGILDTCEYARYSPQSDHSERDQLYTKAIDTISKLENKLR